MSKGKGIRKAPLPVFGSGFYEVTSVGKVVDRSNPPKKFKPVADDRGVQRLEWEAVDAAAERGARRR